MKKMMITLLLATFCWSAFGLESPQQDTTKKRQDTTKKHQDTTKKHQDTTKRHPVKSKMSKKKFPMDSTKKDTMKRRTGDTSKRVPPVF